jgi:hypothetical protein
LKAKSELLAHKVTEEFTNIWLLTNDDGRCRAEVFLCRLQRSEFLKMLAVLKRVDVDTEYRHDERFKQLTPPAFEFKSHRFRLLCFKTERGFICTDGMKKQKSSRTRVSDAAVDATIALAERFAKEGMYVE